MGQATLTNFADGHVRQDRPDQNFDRPVLLRVRNAAGAGSRAYLYTPRPFPLGAWVTSAKLYLTVRPPHPASNNLSLLRVAEHFAMSRVTWNNQPGVVAGSDVVVTRPADGSNVVLYEFDVTMHMRAVSQGVPWFGWRVTNGPGSDPLQIYANDGGLSHRPRLEVEWADYPSAPADLSPGGGRVISLEKPTLGFTFTDVSGDTRLAAVQAQVIFGATPTGAADWDSGHVPTTVPELDLADDAQFITPFPGVAEGGTAWWRARAQDGAGLWSDWSTFKYDWASWTRKAKPTVTMTYPASEGVVEDPTPTVRWTVSGGTQTAYELYLVDRNWTWLWRSGKVSSSSTRAVTVPAGVLKHDSARYCFALRVWDEQEREDTPGDNPYVQVNHWVTFDRDGSMTPITNFTAEPTPEQTGVTLNWERASVPDQWAIVRGYLNASDLWVKEIIQVLDQADVKNSGPGWSWTDYTAHPRRPHNYEVAPVFDGKTGRDGPNHVRTLEPVGVWLLDPDTGAKVMVHQTGDLGWTMGEQSSEHVPLGARRPVLITQGMRGYEGTVSGLLVDAHDLGRRFGGLTAQKARDTLLRLKERPGRVYRLITNDQNIPVVVWNVAISPAPVGGSPHLRFAVSFQFAQVDEFDYDPEL